MPSRFNRLSGKKVNLTDKDVQRMKAAAREVSGEKGRLTDKNAARSISAGFKKNTGMSSFTKLLPPKKK